MNVTMDAHQLGFQTEKLNAYLAKFSEEYINEHPMTSCIRGAVREWSEEGDPIQTTEAQACKDSSVLHFAAHSDKLIQEQRSEADMHDVVLGCDHDAYKTFNICEKLHAGLFGIVIVCK